VTFSALLILKRYFSLLAMLSRALRAQPTTLPLAYCSIRDRLVVVVSLLGSVMEPLQLRARVAMLISHAIHTLDIPVIQYMYIQLIQYLVYILIFSSTYSTVQPMSGAA